MVIDGKKISIVDIMREPTLMKIDATLYDVLKTMIAEKTNSVLIIDEDKKLQGIINAGTVIARIVPDYLEGDAVAAHFATEEIFAEEVKKSKDVPVTEFMNTKINTVGLNASIMEVAVFALSKKQIRIPVVDNENKVVGLLTRTEIKQMIGYYMGIEESFK